MQKQQPAPLSAELRAQARNTATRGTSRARRVGLSDVFSNPTFEPVVKGGFILLLLVGLFFAYLVISSLMQDDDTDWAVGWAHSFILDAIDKKPSVSFSTARSDRRDDAPVWTVAGDIRLQRPDDSLSVVPYEAVIRQVCNVNARSACWKLEQLKLSGEEVDLSQLEFATLRLSDDSGQWVYDRSKFLESARSRAAEYASRKDEGPTPQQTALANLQAREKPSASELAIRENEQMPTPLPHAAQPGEPAPSVTGPVPAPASTPPAEPQSASAEQPATPPAASVEPPAAPTAEAPSPAPTPAPEVATAAAPAMAEPPAPAATPSGGETATDTAASETAAATPQAATEGTPAAATAEATPAAEATASLAAAEPAAAEPTTGAAAAPADNAAATIASEPAPSEAAPSEPATPDTAAAAVAAADSTAAPDVPSPDAAAVATTTSPSPASAAATAQADATTGAPEMSPAQQSEAPGDDLQSVRAALEQALAEAERPTGAASPVPSATPSEPPSSAPTDLTSGMPAGGLDTLARVLRVPSSEPTLPPPPPRNVPGAATPAPGEAPGEAPGSQVAALPPAADTLEAEVLPDGTMLGGSAPRESRPRPAPGSVAASRFEPLPERQNAPAPSVQRGAPPDRETLIFLIQSYLSDAGYDPGPLDGLMGPRTQVAIGQYQADNGLPTNRRPSESLLQHLEQRFLTPRGVDAPGRPNAGAPGDRRAPYDRLVANYAPDGMLAPPSVEGQGPTAPQGPRINRAQGPANTAVGPRRFYRVGVPGPEATTNTAPANAPAGGDGAAAADADAVTMLRLAREAASRDEHNLAIGHYTRAQRAPGITRALIAEALAGRARSYAAIGLYEKARADLTRSIDAAPENAQTYFDRARVYDAMGDTENAIRDYTRAYRLAPDDPRIAGKARELGLAQAGAPAADSPAN